MPCTKIAKKRGQRLGRPLGRDSGFGLFGGWKLQSVSDISPLCGLQILLGIVENLPPKVAELRLGLAVVVEGFQVYDDGGVVAVEFLPDGHIGEQVLVVGDVGHDVAGDYAGPLPAWGPHLVGGYAEYCGGGVNEVVDEGWGHMAAIDGQKVHLKTRRPSKDVRI